MFNMSNFLCAHSDATNLREKEKTSYDDVFHGYDDNNRGRRKNSLHTTNFSATTIGPTMNMIHNTSNGGGGSG